MKNPDWFGIFFARRLQMLIFHEPNNDEGVMLQYLKLKFRSSLCSLHRIRCLYDPARVWFVLLGARYSGEIVKALSGLKPSRTEVFGLYLW